MACPHGAIETQRHGLHGAIAITDAQRDLCLVAAEVVGEWPPQVVTFPVSLLNPTIVWACVLFPSDYVFASYPSVLAAETAHTVFASTKQFSQAAAIFSPLADAEFIQGIGSLLKIWEVAQSVGCHSTANPWNQSAGGFSLESFLFAEPAGQPVRSMLCRGKRQLL